MSFSSTTKQELTRLVSDPRCCQIAQLSAMIHVSGTIEMKGKGRTDILITTESAAIARLVFTLMKKSLRRVPEIQVEENHFMKNGHLYRVVLEDATEILTALGILDDSGGYYRLAETIPVSIVEKACCKRAYIRGAFLGGGSLADPERAYHMEFNTHHPQYAESLKDLINNTYELTAKTVTRKANTVVYLKEGDQIVDLLNVMGAHQTLLSFENVRIVKQVRNSVNRIVNCETANLNKTLDAAERQIESIRTIDAHQGIESLPASLREIARLRLEQPTATLTELGEEFDPPLKKSAVNYRLKKIEKIAEGQQIGRNHHD